MNSNSTPVINVLLVDDDPSLLRSLERALSMYDFVVEAASCAAEAKAFLNHCPIDVIVCDYQMPGQSGLEFLAEVRQVRPNVITFMLSGRVAGLKVAENWANEIGVHQVFSKPCNADEIALSIQAAMAVNAD